MKNTCLIFLLLLATPLFAANETNLANTNPPLRSATDWHEPAEGKVLKVYSVTESNAEFRAYVVLWKGHEVVVSDLFGTSNYHEGDTIKFGAGKLTLGRGTQKHDILHFLLLPDPNPRRIIDFGKVKLSEMKQPWFLDCHPDNVIIYPDSITNSWETLQHPDNPVAKLLDGIDANKESERVIVMARPDSVKFYRAVRKMINSRSIDVTYDAVDTDFKVEGFGNAPYVPLPTAPATEPSKIATANSKSTAAVNTKRRAFFECRQNEVFYMNMEAIDEQVAKILMKGGKGIDPNNLRNFNKGTNTEEIGNECYKVLPESLQKMIITLEPRANVHGDSPEQLIDPHGKFQTTLEHLDPDTQQVVFLIHDDNFKAFRAARKLAEQLGFETNWELLGIDEPIKFGTGGMIVTPQ